MCSGELVTAIAMTEPTIGSDLASMKTTAVRDGDHFIVNGSKTFITNGINADLVITAVKTDPAQRHTGMSLLVVERGMEGFERGRNLEKIGLHSQDTAELFFNDVRVPVANLLGEVGTGFLQLVQNLPQERLSIAVSAVAAASQALKWTLEYAKEREAFGRAIGRFQVIRHKFAEMATKIEAARQMTYMTAWRIHNGEYPVREISMAKLYASRVCHEVADECIQIMGGYGYMKEYEIERAFRDQRLNRIGAGTDEIMLEVIGRSYGL
jgi:alkylation response protein AidB-like acyl-CoA dehydrogenase